MKRFLAVVVALAIGGCLSFGCQKGMGGKAEDKAPAKMDRAPMPPPPPPAPPPPPPPAAGGEQPPAAAQGK